jgi:hypothetical protein
VPCEAAQHVRASVVPVPTVLAGHQLGEPAACRSQSGAVCDLQARAPGCGLRPRLWRGRALMRTRATTFTMTVVVTSSLLVLLGADAGRRPASDGTRCVSNRLRRHGLDVGRVAAGLACGQALLEAGAVDRDSLGLLLEEAFHGDRGLKLFDEYDAASPKPYDRDPWGAAAPSSATRHRLGVQLVRDMVGTVDHFPRYASKRYYSARLTPQPEPVLAPAEARAAWAREVGQLAAAGYFDDHLGSSCCDAGDNPDGEGQRRLSDMLHVDARLWPVAHWENGQATPTGTEQAWPEELFFGVVEALHDLVARPRRRGWHDYCREWDYFDFARAPGQAVYRWRTNAVLERSELDLRLADTGEEAGFLVRVVGDGREELVAQVGAVQAERDTRQHAIALFRARGAGVPEKRSAILALYGLLEARRGLIKSEMLRKDEGDLFSIANQFALRHQGADQRPDYDEAYLNWLFWWYLSTLDLTDHLLARPGEDTSAAIS